MQSSVLLLIRMTYKEKVSDSPNSYTNVQPEKEVTAYEEWKRHMVKGKKKEDCKDIIKKQMSAIYQMYYKSI